MFAQTLFVAGLLFAASGCESDEPEAAGTRLAQLAQPEAVDALGTTAGPNYTIAHVPVALTPGEPGELVLRVTPGPGFKVNVEYPWSLALELPAVVSAPQTELGVGDAAVLSEDEAVYRVPVTLSEAPDAVVSGDLRFSICNDARCDVLRAQVAWAVTAAE